MGWSGCEVIVKALCRAVRARGGPNPKEIDAAISPLCLPAFTPVCPPKRTRRSLETWLDQGVKAKRQAILDFLGLETGDANIMDSWLIQGRPTASWADSMKLAKAIRNCSAHGALSANKVREWGLRPACGQLLADLATVVTAILAELARNRGESR
jgi:hypothetical protein